MRELGFVYAHTDLAETIRAAAHSFVATGSIKDADSRRPWWQVAPLPFVALLLAYLLIRTLGCGCKCRPCCKKKLKQKAAAAIKKTV